jgi:hypothetical protein
VLTLTGFMSWGKALTFSNKGLFLLVGRYTMRQLSLEVDLRSVGNALAESVHDWGRRVVPLLNYTVAFALQLRKSTEIISQGSRVVRDYSLRRHGRHFRDSLGWRTEHQSTSVTRGWLQSALGRHKCLPSCRTRDSPHQLNLRRNSQRVTWCGRRRMEFQNPRGFACY